MKNYKSSSSPLVDKAILDDAQKAANSTIDAVDSLNRKKRELEELKTQNDINTEKKKLANTNTGNNEQYVKPNIGRHIYACRYSAEV